MDLVLDGPAYLLAEAEDIVVGDPVVDAHALFAPGEHPALGQQHEVLGSVLLRGVKLVRELLHGGLTVTQMVEQSDPHRRGQQMKAAGDQLD